MKFLFSVIILLAIGTANVQNVKAQSIDTLVYHSTKIIPFGTSFDKEIIEELSGIEYTGKANEYYIIPQSRKKAYFFRSTLTLSRSEVEVKFDSVIYLNHAPVEAESIRINPKDNQIYIAEEGNGTSYVFRVNAMQKLETIFTSTKEQRYNRGYEGLCFSPNGELMFMGLERPKTGDTTNIIAYNLETHSKVVYNYALDVLANDKRNDNGITELLTINDSTLLVVERAYLGAKFGSSIRVYKASIPSEGNRIIKTKLLTNFSSAPQIDNIEGVTYSASGKELIFISDNNSNPNQQNLFIVMKIE